MKKVLILVAIGILCFVVGTVGIYIAMPSLSPDKVDGTRVRLDSLGLIARSESNLGAPDSPETVSPESVPPDSFRSNITDSTALPEKLPTPQEIIQTLKDSIKVSNNIIRDLKADTSSLTGRIRGLISQVEELSEKDFEATQLSQSLAKLDAKQLGNILAGLDLDIIELLYQKASARERTRLLESMSPEQAARFVQILVKGPQPQAALETKEPDNDPTNPANEAPSNQ